VQQLLAQLAELEPDAILKQLGSQLDSLFATLNEAAEHLEVAELEPQPEAESGGAEVAEGHNKNTRWITKPGANVHNRSDTVGVGVDVKAITCRSQSNRAQRYIRLQLFPSTFK
jgi:hypothetical protein